MRKVLFAIALIVALAPRPVAACGLFDFISCVSDGVTDRTEIRNERMTEIAATEAQRDRDIANITAQAQERVEQAHIEVERVKLAQYQSETDRQIAIANAEAKAKEYEAMIAGMRDERIAEIAALAATQLQSLQSAADIHIAGITETGSTERLRIGMGWTAIFLLIIIPGALCGLWLWRGVTGTKQVVVLLDGGTQWRLGRGRRELVNDECVESEYRVIETRKHQ